MSMMREVPYLLMLHYVVIAMRDISFPVSKAEIIEKVGDIPIRNTPDASVPFRQILENMPLEQYSCAAEFYCALSAS